ncbi:GNAT family N-acetyltransferase [Rhodobacteraceae bacterium 10Alg 79]|uniref:GNAT family N-acetyltransferase n=2 Tax=Rhodalgimonas zhirmunskyi TaxID=2964767 RepID=A0AAJ1U327_9RHOB|nr:GNAT family N-acetyltransferase [Rhodoalgimonas zhirmunskyi]
MTQLNPLGQPIGDPIHGTFPRPRPERTLRTGRYCALVPLAIDHAPALHTAYERAPDGRGWTYLPNGPYESARDYEAWVAEAVVSRDPLFFTVEDPEGQPMGTCSYLRIAPEAGVIEVGFINFSPLMQQSRASTEAMFLMMAHAFDDLGYRRYEWKCDTLNAPSRRAARRLGFTYEGTFRQATHYKGRNRDTAWYAMLDHEWPAIRAEFVRWLDPANFDANGQQLSRLEMPERSSDGPPDPSA